MICGAMLAKLAEEVHFCFLVSLKLILCKKAEPALPQARDFSNGLKNPTDNAFSVGFFYPLEIS
jgi:hypothetical protein